MKKTALCFMLFFVGLIVSAQTVIAGRSHVVDGGQSIARTGLVCYYSGSANNHLSTNVPIVFDEKSTGSNINGSGRIYYDFVKNVYVKQNIPLYFSWSGTSKQGNFVYAEASVRTSQGQNYYEVFRFRKRDGTRADHPKYIGSISQFDSERFVSVNFTCDFCHKDHNSQINVFLDLDAPNTVYLNNEINQELNGKFLTTEQNTQTLFFSQQVAEEEQSLTPDWDLPEDGYLSEYPHQCGFWGYLIDGNEFEYSIDNPFPEIPMEESDHTIQTLDRLKNASVSLNLHLEPDYQPPSAVSHLNNLSYTVTKPSNPAGTFGVLIPIYFQSQGEEKGIHLYDEISGIYGYDITLYMDGEEVSKPGLDQQQDDIFFLQNLERGHSYRFGIRAIDNVGNRSEEILSETFGMPVIPVLDGESSFLQWDENKVIPSFYGRLLLQEGSFSELEELSLFAGEKEIAQWKEVDWNIWNFSPVNGTNLSEWEFEIPLEDEQWQQSVLHRDVPVILRARPVSGEPIDFYYELDPLPNRLPSHSETSDLVLLSGEWETWSAPNQSGLYQAGLVSENRSLAEELSHRLSTGWPTEPVYCDGSPLALSFTDRDGDSISIAQINHQNRTYLYLLEAGEAGFSQAYLLPCHLITDILPPEFQQPRFLLEEQNAQIFQGDNAALLPLTPDTLIIPDITENSGILRGELVFGDQGYPLENPEMVDGFISLPWPFGDFASTGETKRRTLTITLTDLAGNSAALSRDLVVDRTKPVLPNGSTEILRIDSPDLYPRYYPDTGQIHLEFNPDFLGPDPLEAIAFSVDEEILNSADCIESYSIEDEALRVTLVKDCVPNRQVEIPLILKDQAGNSSTLTCFVATPAKIAAEEITLLGLENQEYYAWNGTHRLGFTRSSTATENWSAIALYRDEMSDPVTDGKEALRSEEVFYDGGLEPHGTYTYQVLPVNASGFADPTAAITLTGLNLGNFSPLGAFTNRMEREGRIFFGPQGKVPIELDDPDGDSLSLQFLVDDKEWQNAAGTGPYTLDIDPADYETSVLSPDEGERIFVDGESYNLQLRIHDNVTERKTPLVLTDPEEWIWDESPPETLEIREWINPSLTPWGDRGLKVQAEDGGSGVQRIWSEIKQDDYSEILEADPNENVMAGWVDGQPLEFDFPEGIFDLTLWYEDRLGNREFKEMGVIRSDQTPPVITTLALANPEEIFLEGETATYSYPLVKLIFHWEDNSGLSSAEYQYRSDNQVICSGARDFADPDKPVQAITCPPVTGALNEGDLYQLYLRVFDLGGNVSEWVEFSSSIRFDLQAPLLEVIGWDLPLIQGSFVSTSSTAPLPEIIATDTLSDNVEVNYRLLDGKGTFLQTVSGSLNFPDQGSFLLEISASDPSGLESLELLPVIYDTTAPTGLKLDWVPEEAAAGFPGETLYFSLSGSDALTGIERFRYRLLRGSTVVLDRDIPYAEAVLEMLVLPESLIPGSYSLQASARDGAGNTSALTTVTSLTVEEAVGEITIEMPLYLGRGQDLGFRWDYGGSETISHYEVDLVGLDETGSRLLYHRETADTHLRLTFGELDLDGLTALNTQVRPVTVEGIRLATVSSPRTTIDIKPPGILSFETPEMIRPQQLRISLACSDESPLLPPEFLVEQIETSGEYLEITPLTRIALETPITTGEMDLAYYLTGVLTEEVENIRIRLEIRDRAGNLSEAMSPLIPVIHDNAQDFAVIDQGDYINPLLNDLEFHWLWAQENPRTGEEGYWYQLAEEGAVDPEGWIFTPEREVSFSGIPFGTGQLYEDGDELFLYVKRQTSAGEEQLVSSNGIVLDSSAPVITEVELRDGENRLLEDIHYTGDKDLQLQVTGYDPESGIDRFRASAGTLSEGGFVSIGEPVDNPMDLIPMSLPLGRTEGEVLCFEVRAFNGVGGESLPSYSRGVIYNPEGPAGDKLTLSASSESVSVSWEAKSGTPLVQQNLEIYYNGSVLLSRTLEGGARHSIFKNLNLEDGEYRALLKLFDAAGRIEEIRSPLLILDNTAPTLTTLKVSEFLYKRLECTVGADEGMTELRINLSTETRTILDRSISLGSGVMNWEGDFDLTEQSLWNEMSSWENRILYFTIRMRDRRGNWSDPVSKTLFFDGTPPSTPAVFLNNRLFWGGTEVILEPMLTGNPDCLRQVSLLSTEDLSPVSHYRWALVSQPGEEPIFKNPFRAVENPSVVLDLNGLTLDGLTLAHRQSYYLALQVKNEAGGISEIGYSDLFKADLQAPVFTLQAKDPETIDNNGDNPIAVFSGELRLRAEIQDEESPYLVQTLRIFDPDGNESGATSISPEEEYPGETFTPSGWDRKEGDQRDLSVPYDSLRAGIFLAELTLEDLHGRKSTEKLSFRNNLPPKLHIPEGLTARPGQILRLPYSEWAVDSDGLQSLILAGGSLETPLEKDWGEPLELTLKHKEAQDQQSVYSFQISVTDKLGRSTTEELIIQIENTSSGILLTDEYWSGIHNLTGPVTVPSGITLTIAPDTEIQALGDYGEVDNVYNQALILKRGSALVLLGEASWSAAGEKNEPQWLGIFSEIDLNLKNQIIENAERGLTMSNNTTLFLNNSVFRNNRIGLHLNGSDSSITDCIFEGNLYYGLKGEDSVNSIMIGNLFRNNGYDYYDSEKTVLNGDQIDSLNDTNKGNRGE